MMYQLRARICFPVHVSRIFLPAPSWSRWNSSFGVVGLSALVFKYQKRLRLWGGGDVSYF